MAHEALLRSALALVRSQMTLAAAMERLTEELTRDRQVDEVTARRRRDEPGDYGAAASSRP